MTTSGRNSDWLHASQGEDERAGSDRRAANRRAPRRPIDPLFAATLLRQIEPATTDYVEGYRPPAAPLRCGGIVNRWA